MHKGEWRQVRGSLSKIREYMQEELERRKKDKSQESTTPAREAKSPPEQRLPACPGSRKRQPGPFRVVEVCTWTCMVSAVAATLAWEVLEQITLPKYDLLTRKGRDAVRAALLAADPDFIALAPPCTEWSQLQSVNQRTPMQVRRLGRRRKRLLVMLAFFDELAQWQHERGVHGNHTAWMLENPPTFQAVDPGTYAGDCELARRWRCSH